MRKLGKGFASGVILFFVFVIFLPVGGKSETQPELQTFGSESKTLVDSLENRIESLENEVEQGNYIRIPNSDFENIIDNKIQKSLRETVNWWLIVIAALVSALGFLINKYARSYLQTIVDGKINQLKNDNEEQIKNISKKYFSSVIESLVDFKIKTIQEKGFVVDEPTVEDLMGYLKDETITISKKKKVDLIDTIMRCYYFSNLPQRLEKMIKLIKEYEDEYTLAPSTYTNAAIAFSNMYDVYGTKDYLDSAIENCNNSIRILPDYGLACAQNPELFVIEQTKALGNEEKQFYEKELKKVFKEIENNRSEYLCQELINRFVEDEDTYMKSYLEILYATYPDEITKIRTRANSSKSKDSQ